MSDRDLDAEFARIIAGWDDEAPDPLPRTPRADVPAADDAGDDADPVAREESPEGRADGMPDAGPGGTRPGPGTPEVPGAPGAPGGTSNPAPASGLLEVPIAPTTSHAWRGGSARDDADPVEDDDGEHFVPPSEIDLPSAENDPMFWAIVGGLVGGPLLLLYLLFFDRDGSGWWIVTALAMVVVGFVLLVLRGGTERDPFDDGTRL